LAATAAAAATSPTADTMKLNHEVDVKLWTPEQEAKVTLPKSLFTSTTRAIVWGMQPRACQVLMYILINYCC